MPWLEGEYWEKWECWEDCEDREACGAGLGNGKDGLAGRTRLKGIDVGGV